MIKAVLGYEDPENKLPATRIVATGKCITTVEQAAVAIYSALLHDKIGTGRQVAGRLGERHRLAALDELRIGVYDGSELVLKIGGEQHDD